MSDQPCQTNMHILQIFCKLGQLLTVSKTGDYSRYLNIDQEAINEGHGHIFLSDEDLNFASILYMKCRCPIIKTNERERKADD